MVGVVFRFIMPSKYWTSLETAPAPAENSGVLLQERPVETLAVSCFGGYALQATVAKKWLGQGWSGRVSNMCKREIKNTRKTSRKE